MLGDGGVDANAPPAERDSMLDQEREMVEMRTSPDEATAGDDGDGPGFVLCFVVWTQIGGG
jgi:hypothetical protein